MRYTIPKKDTDQKAEVNRILHAAATDDELQKINRALQWLLGCANGTVEYRKKNYDKLYDIYKMLGITGGRKESDLFPEPSRTKENFREELNQLWRILEVYAQEKSPSLLTSCERYKKHKDEYDTALSAYDTNLRDQRNRQGLAELQPERDQEQKIPLVDEKSPYADRIRGSVYSEIYQLYRDLKPQLRPGKSLSDRMLSSDMDQLLTKMQLHYLRRNSKGTVFPMTVEERGELLELYRDCLRDCQRLSEKFKKKQEYKTLHTLLLKNEEQLRNAPEDNLPPFADVVRGSHAQTIELIAQEKETIGDALSSREAVEYTDADGNIRRGFFTAEKILVDEDKGIDAIANQYEKQYPQYADYFKRIKSIKNTREFQSLLVDTYEYHVKKSKKVKTEPVKACFKDKKWMSSTDREQEHFWNDTMIPMIIEMTNSAGMQDTMRSSGIDTGDRLAERASAMNDVAHSLGYPDLLVGTRRVTVMRGDKKETGVMMDPTDMDLIDPAKILNDDHPFYKVNEKDFDSREMLSSLADLQILDYLCANTDRHRMNFFLRMDLSESDHPKLLGVQGIDNDNSFGKLNDGGVLKLAGSENLKIITPKMADAVEGMTEEKLQEILSPYHLSEKQIEAAGTRLKKLQSMIKKGRMDEKLHFDYGEDKEPRTLLNPEGTIHIVKDKEWKKLSLGLLVPVQNFDDEEERNLFVYAAAHLGKLKEKQAFLSNYKDLQDDLKNAKTELDKQLLFSMWKSMHPEIKIDEQGNLVNYKQEEEAGPIRYTRQADKVDYQKLANLQEKELADLKNMQKQFDDAHGSMNDAKRSRKFKTMRAALDALVNEYQKMRSLDPSKILIDEEEKEELEQKRDQNLAECYKRIEQRRQSLKQAIDIYNDIWHWKRKPSENNQKRINTAKKLSGIVMDVPSSEQFYKSSKTVQDTQRKRESAQDAFEQNRYLTNQIHSMMKNTLLDNVNALKLNDPLREKGRQALKAHERLWNYSQNAVNVKRELKESEKKKLVPLEQLLREEQLKKADALPNEDQICKDLNKIKEYAPQLSESIDRIINGEDKITPKRILGVLNELYIDGSKIAKERGKAANEKNIVNVEKRTGASIKS